MAITTPTPFAFRDIPITQNRPKPGSHEAEEYDQVCTKCGCQWLELVLVQRWSKLDTVVLGQKPTPKTSAGYYVFRCVKCGELFEPSVSVSQHESGFKPYEAFVKQLEEPIPPK